jgi:hypothetical protein
MNARVVPRLTLMGVDDRLDRPLVMAPSGAFWFSERGWVPKGSQRAGILAGLPREEGPAVFLSGVGGGRDRNHPKHRECAIPPYHDMVALGRTT